MTLIYKIAVVWFNDELLILTILNFAVAVFERIFPIAAAYNLNIERILLEYLWSKKWNLRKLDTAGLKLYFNTLGPSSNGTLLLGSSRKGT